MPFRSSVRCAVLAAVLAATRAAAQGGTLNPACSDTAFVGPALVAGNACQRAFDSFAYATQQYAILLSAGNIEPGKADAVGGFPHFRVALHVTGMSLAAPALKTSQIPPGAATPGDINTQPTDFVVVAADGTLGIFGGIDAGFARILAVDGWASLNVVPHATATGYSVTPSSTFYMGWGGRVGVIQEGSVMPGIGVSYIQRNLPKSTVIASDLFDNTLYVYNMTVDTHAWAATIGKHFGSVVFALGAGQTTFSSGANITWSYNGVNPTVEPLVTATSVQTQYFGDFGLALSGFEIILEIGQVQGSTLQTYNTFDPQAGAARSFASVAVSFGH